MSLPVVGAEVGSSATALDRVTAQTPIVTALERFLAHAC